MDTSPTFIVFIIYLLLKETLAYFCNSFYLTQCYGLIQNELKQWIWIYNASFTVRGKRECRKIAVKCHWIPCLLFAIYILFVKASGADWVRCCRRYGRHCGAREPTWGAKGKFFKIKIKNVETTCSKENRISNSVYCVQENSVQYSRLFQLYVIVNICFISYAGNGICANSGVFCLWRYFFKILK